MNLHRFEPDPKAGSEYQCVCGLYRYVPEHTLLEPNKMDDETLALQVELAQLIKTDGSGGGLSGVYADTIVSLIEHIMWLQSES